MNSSDKLSRSSAYFECIVVEKWISNRCEYCIMLESKVHIFRFWKCFDFLFKIKTFFNINEFYIIYIYTVYIYITDILKLINEISNIVFNAAENCQQYYCVNLNYKQEANIQKWHFLLSMWFFPSRYFNSFSVKFNHTNDMFWVTLNVPHAILRGSFCS